MSGISRLRYVICNYDQDGLDQREYNWQKKLLVESQKMIPETQSRLGAAVSELRDLVVSLILNLGQSSL